MAQEYDKYCDSYYSTYQTDDKKYDSRTGPFEGFFVNSVDILIYMLNLKIEKIMLEIIEPEPRSACSTRSTWASGATGAPGPRGIQGIQGLIGPNGTIGPQGLAGDLFINNTNLYEVLGNNATSGFFSQAFCDAVDVVFEGGFNILVFPAPGAKESSLIGKPRSFGNLGNAY